MANTITEPYDSILTALPNVLIAQIQHILTLGGKRQINELHLSILLTKLRELLNGSVKTLVQKLKAIYEKYQTQIQPFLANINMPQSRTSLQIATQHAKSDIIEAFNSLLNEAIGHLQTIATSLVNTGLGSLLIALQGGKRGIIDSFSDIFNNLSSTVNGHIDNVSSTLTTSANTLWSSIQPHLQDLQDQLTNHALNAAQSLLSSLASISQTING